MTYYEKLKISVEKQICNWSISCCCFYLGIFKPLCYLANLPIWRAFACQGSSRWAKNAWSCIQARNSYESHPVCVVLCSTKNYGLNIHEPTSKVVWEQCWSKNAGLSLCFMIVDLAIIFDAGDQQDSQIKCYRILHIFWMGIPICWKKHRAQPY